MSSSRYRFQYPSVMVNGLCGWVNETARKNGRSVRSRAKSCSLRLAKYSTSSS